MSVTTWTHAAGFRWDHVQLTPEGRDWLRWQGLDSLALAALTAEDTRPRVTPFAAGTVIVLRGVNLNAGAEVEDMISIRLWCAPGRCLSVWLRPLRAVADLQADATAGQVPESAGAFVSRLALKLSNRAGEVVAGLIEEMDALEEALIAEDQAPGQMPDQGAVSGLRRKIVVLRRYFAPQAAALTDLARLDVDWLSERCVQRIEEARDRMQRMTEDLDALSLRGQVVQDHLAAHRAERMNTQMYVMSVAAALFLPLGFLTGLLGVNVAGVPGTETPYAFWIVCALMLVLGVAQWLVFRALGLVRGARGSGKT